MLAFHSDKKVKQGKNSHQIVGLYFENRGFTVYNAETNMKTNGIDLVVAKGNKTWSVEVKKASKSARVWRVQFLTKQYDSDLVAIVLPNGDVQVISGRMAKEASNKSNSLCLGKLPDAFS